MNKENQTQPCASSARTLTPAQLEQIAGIADSLMNDLYLEKVTEFIVLHAWQCAERGDVPNEDIFFLRAQLQQFETNMKLVKEMK